MVRSLLLYQMLRQCYEERNNLESDESESDEDDHDDDVNSLDDGASRASETSEVTRHQNVKREKKPESSCRVCLKEGDIPIFGGDTTEDIPGALKTIADIDVSCNDSFPKSICSTCNMILQDAVMLRQTAQKSDSILKKHSENVDNDSMDFDNENYNSVDYDNEPGWMEGDNTVKDEDLHKRLIKSENSVTACGNPEDWDDENSSPFDNLIVTKLDASCSNNENWLQYKCNKCNLSFDSFESYNEHRTTDEHRNESHECPICHETFTTGQIRNHMLEHKKNPPEFMCDICGRKFKSKGVFGSHRLTHSYDLPFKCSLCPYRGRFKNVLKVHMRSHTGERPYLCTECPARFVHKSNLSKHLLTHKEKKREFMCDPCNRGFYTKKDLELHHKVVHIGVKDHVCRICGKAFGYRSHLRRHELKVHKRAKLRSGKMPVYLKAEIIKQQGLESSCES